MASDASRDRVGVPSRGDYGLSRGIDSVELADKTAEQIRAYIADYGETLVELPHATWNTSVAQWTGTHWDVVVDLSPVGEGRGDMVLDAKVPRRSSPPTSPSSSGVPCSPAPPASSRSSIVSPSTPTASRSSASPGATSTASPPMTGRRRRRAVRGASARDLVDRQITTDRGCRLQTRRCEDLCPDRVIDPNRHAAPSTPTATSLASRARSTTWPAPPCGDRSVDGSHRPTLRSRPRDPREAHRRASRVPLRRAPAVPRPAAPGRRRGAELRWATCDDSSPGLRSRPRPTSCGPHG